MTGSQGGVGAGMEPGTPSLAPGEGPGSGARTADSGGSGGASVAELYYARIRGEVEARKIYPAAARLRGTEGSVRVRLRISAAGGLLAASLASSSGSSLLDEAALALVSSVFPLPNPAGRELDPVLTVTYSLRK